MGDLKVNKSAFDLCYENLKTLSASLLDASFTWESSKDTSMTGEKERQCYEELLKMIADLAALADETAKDVRLTQANYMLVDQ